MAQDKLTDKQEKFAQAVASGSDQATAYRQCYSCDGWADSSVWCEASKLRSHTKVSQRIKELQAQNEQQEIWTRRNLMERLERIAEDARQARNRPILDADGNLVGTQIDAAAARVELQAADQAAKIIGAYTERREIDVSGSLQTTLSPEDKLKIIAEIKDGATD